MYHRKLCCEIVNWFVTGLGYVTVTGFCDCSDFPNKEFHCKLKNYQLLK